MEYSLTLKIKDVKVYEKSYSFKFDIIAGSECVITGNHHGKHSWISPSAFKRELSSGLALKSVMDKLKLDE